jgi:homoserine dehydrogenase
MGDVPTRYHVSLEVADRTGVLSAIAGEFSRRGVSIAAVRQTGGQDGFSPVTGEEITTPAGEEESARLVVVTHGAEDSALAATVEAIAKLDVVRAVESVLRVEGLGRTVSALGVAG